MIMNTEQLSARLAESGIHLVGLEETVTSRPPSAAFAATGCGPEDGRVDFRVEYDSPDPLGDVNRAWYALATRFGLLDGTREFLLWVDLHDGPDAADLRWARVAMERRGRPAHDNQRAHSGRTHHHVRPR
ncbi:hypothetical protein ACFVYP_40305 [Kitasatospora sp. NPDC058201]|uniref:hypothetical protein n=1 Tax=unclassified Kitasatospora TaxID=2633591 RepID=UPI00364F2BC7